MLGANRTVWLTTVPVPAWGVGWTKPPLLEAVLVLWGELLMLPGGTSLP